MEMICIKGGYWTDYKGKFPGPKTDEIVTVTRHYKCHFEGREYTMLILAEYTFIGPTGTVLGYDSRCFAPVGDISELMEILNTTTCDSSHRAK